MAQQWKRVAIDAALVVVLMFVLQGVLFAVSEPWPTEQVVIVGVLAFLATTAKRIMDEVYRRRTATRGENPPDASADEAPRTHG